MRSFALALALLALPSMALAAKKAKPSTQAKAEEKAQEAEPTPPAEPAPAAAHPQIKEKHEAKHETNEGRSLPVRMSSYQPWGTRGGALLGGAAGFRVNAFGGNHLYGDGYGFGGLEALYFFKLSPSVDFGLGMRLSGWALGLAPGMELRAKLYRGRAFHMAFSFGAWAPVTFRGMFGGITVGAHAEPGLLFSYFFADNIEFVFGALVPMTLHIISFYFPVPEIGFAGRLGFVYTFKKHNLGLMFVHDIAPGFYTYGGFPRAESTLANAVAAPAFMVAANFMLGLQFKL